MADTFTELAECEFKLTLVDPDVFEPKSPYLQSPLPPNAGQAKAAVLTEMLSRSPPSTDQNASVDRLEDIGLEGLHREVTVVFVDSMAARREANALTHHLIPRPARAGTLDVQSKPPKDTERKES